MSVYDSIMQGLSEAVEHSQGVRKLSTRTVTVQPLQEYRATDIKAIRNTLGASQALFANIMGVSVKTIEAWECGRNQPDGAARRLLALMEHDPQLPAKYHIIQSQRLVP